jgi:3-oxoacyl-[acyl-carrier protein] reductase
MDLRLKDKVALVTGATRGIGRTIARMLAEESCHVVAVARRPHPLDEVAHEFERLGLAPPLTLTQDITDVDAAERIKDATIARFGRLDILVNNAGGSRPFTGKGSREQWDEAMQLNFHAGRELAHAFVDEMRTRGFGRIINITGSDEPVQLNGAMPPNGATHIWAKALSRVVAKDGVTVNSISPGRIHSEQLDERVLPTEEAQREWLAANCPAGYIGEPEDLAVLVLLLASPRGRYITGQVVHVDGGAHRFSH